MFGSRTPSPTGLEAAQNNAMDENELFGTNLPNSGHVAAPLMNSSSDSNIGNGIIPNGRSNNFDVRRNVQEELLDAVGSGRGAHQVPVPGRNGHQSPESPGRGINLLPDPARRRVNLIPDAGAPNRARQYRRPLPQPRPFEGRNEESIEHFFRTFERYASSAWSDDQADWIAGLENFLLSWPLTLYRGLVIQGKSYGNIKDALFKAFPGLRDPLNTKHLITLLNLKREPGEPLSVFFMRTDNVLAQTYPGLEEEAKRIMVRDTFLIKLDAALATKIANYCNAKEDFSYDAVRVAAAVIDTPNTFLQQDTVLLAVPKEQGGGKLGTITTQGGSADMRCYLCGGSWHPVSACPLYPMVFKCTLCKASCHALTDCPLYPSIRQLSERGSQAAAWSEQEDQYRTRYRDEGGYRGYPTTDRTAANDRWSSNDRTVWPYGRSSARRDSQGWNTENRYNYDNRYTRNERGYDQRSYGPYNGRDEYYYGQYNRRNERDYSRNGRRDESRGQRQETRSRNNPGQGN